ncbi:ryanodine receptor 1 isoform X1 [Lates japonicus]|uniref:Ryanodine receptor 1 isoform X1 n=1 Tax=Lates japonicus TaxID=270547 RepID=A0AAD3MF25_LATJO|nr:ryanodine receptor 1 isoform X1 [Lates japonicus]
MLAGLQLCPSCSAPQEKEMEKQRLLYQQSRLHNRGAAEMVLQMISACKGEPEPRVSSTLNWESPSSMEATVMYSR